jgi:hypothetical protein
MDQAYPLLRRHLKLHDENTIECGRQLQRLTPVEQEAVSNWNPQAYGLKANHYNTALVIRWLKDRNWKVDAHNLALAMLSAKTHWSDIYSGIRLALSAPRLGTKTTARCVSLAISWEQT